jgi:hypothetical protein
MPARPAASACLVLLSLLGAAARAQGTPPPAPPADPVAVTERFIAGFNHHDLGLMIAETDADVRLLTVVDDRIVLDSRGQTALQESTAKFLSVYPMVRKTIEQSIAHGPFVSTWERSRWKGRNGNDLTQAMLVVYEIQQGKIKNIWRYSPQQ